MSDVVNYELVDFEGSLQNSLDIEKNIDDLASYINTFQSSLDSRLNSYYTDYSDFKRLDYCKNDLSNDVTNVNSFHNWLREGYNEYLETAHQTEEIANGAGSIGGSGGSGGSGGGSSNIATELSPLSSDLTTDSIGAISGGVSDTTSLAGSDGNFGSSSSTSSTSDGSLGSSGSGTQTSLGNNASAIAAGVGVAAAAGAGAAAIGGASSATTTTDSSSSSSGNLSGQAYNGGDSGGNSFAKGELNHIMGNSDENDDDDDDEKKDSVDISTDITKNTKDKVDKIISKTKKVIPKLHSSEVGDSSGTGTSAGGIAATGLGGLGAIGAISGGIAYANNKLNTDDEEEKDDDDDVELGDYDDEENDEKNGSNGDGQISNKDWLYSLGIGLGAATMAKKIKDDKDDKDDEENENSNQ